MTGTAAPAAPAAAPRAVPDAPNAEQVRRAEIDEQMTAFIEGFPSLVDAARAARARAHLNRETTAEAFGAELLELADRDEPLTRGGGSIQHIADGGDKLALGIERAVLLRCDHHAMVPDNESGVNEFAAMPAYELARQWLEFHGVDTRGYTRTRLIEASMVERAVEGPAANTTATFPDILANIARNSIQAGFDEHEATYQIWCQIRSRPDFKEFAVAGLSAFNDLPTVLENGEYLEGTYVDKAERGTLAKYGRRFSITWEALINDQLDAFSEIAPGMGRAAARTIDKLPYSTVLIANPTMREDSQPLFEDGTNRGAVNANLLSNALSETGIDATKVRMLRQVDKNSVEIHPRLRYIIIPSELGITLEKILNDTMIPVSVGSGATREHNTVAGRYTSVETPWLTDTNDWYGAADRNTVQMSFLDGNRNPTTERAMGFKHDAVWFKVRHVAVALASDYRGLVKNVVAGG